ncbi:DUF1415 domain-containing protein [Salinimonas chungwhensis]|uniref:DUF1415 domain-containing protein n=1 Tax=Salinimonas chungwhensis TaxID=265425 RepID=UPI0003745AC8|nr:DUF1415 domain-containing protein [Salinimonas chungwhensis]
MNNKTIIEAVRYWVDDVVIAHNFCPFAGFVRQPETIHYAVCEAQDSADIMVALYDECRRLDDDDSISTTLLMLPALRCFDEYLDTLALAQTMMSQWHYEGEYQLASFHPDYQFEGEPVDSPSNYTNRAPYPVFHLIRERDITRALEDYDDPASIFEKNIARAEQLGCQHLQSQVQHCRKKAGAEH